MYSSPRAPSRTPSAGSAERIQVQCFPGDGEDERDRTGHARGPSWTGRGKDSPEAGTEARLAGSAWCSPPMIISLAGTVEEGPPRMTHVAGRLRSYPPIASLSAGHANRAPPTGTWMAGLIGDDPPRVPRMAVHSRSDPPHAPVVGGSCLPGGGESFERPASEALRSRHQDKRGHSEDAITREHPMRTRPLFREFAS